MLTLAFAQLLYAEAYKWTSVTGGSDGLAGIPRRPGPFALHLFVSRIGFYYLGLLQGAAGGVFALLIVAVLLAAMNSELRPLADSYGSSFRLAFPSATASLAMLAMAGGLGWLGAHLSVSRHLRNIEPR